VASVKGKSILVLCGKGNNGGDGAALARILWTEGSHVVPVLFGQIAGTSGEARTNFEILRNIDEDVLTSGGEFNKLLLHQDDEGLIELLERCLSARGDYLVVDALFGTGLTRELAGIHVDVIQRLENHTPEIIAIDIRRA
jgi:NAD(P)H-hydrate epimerase